MVYVPIANRKIKIVTTLFFWKVVLVTKFLFSFINVFDFCLLSSLPVLSCIKTKVVFGGFMLSVMTDTCQVAESYSNSVR